jgi:putative mRNA 3-end processing factor
MRNDELIVLRREGMYCPLGGFYIDPILHVENAVISHGHADHARNGHKKILCSNRSEKIIRHRVKFESIQSLNFQESIRIDDIKLTMYPASHVLGAAQILLETKGRRWLYTGDFRLAEDSSCDAFEPIKTDVLVMESTFGLPIFRWRDELEVFKEIFDMWENCKQTKMNLVLYCYSLGKSQRILHGMKRYFGTSAFPGNIRVHPSISAINNIYKHHGIDFPDHSAFSLHKEAEESTLIILPPSVKGTKMIDKCKPCIEAVVSGWMAVRGNRRRETGCKGFVLSDHADWNELNRLVELTEAKNVITVHGKSNVFRKYIEESGVGTSDLTFANSN